MTIHTMASTPRKPLTYRQADVRPSFLPTMDTACICGLRYGQHRVKDCACPNQQWRPGNGQAQWREVTFVRA